MCLKTSKVITTQAKSVFFPLQSSAYQLSIHSAIEEVKEDWSLVAPANNDFLQVPYLTFLEQNPPEGIQFRYLLFRDTEGNPIGCAICQLATLKVGESLNTPELPPYQQKINSLILSMANMNALICGNLLLTGEHNMHFINSIPLKIQCPLIKEAMEIVKNQLKEANYPISLILLKDLSSERKETLKAALNKDYNEFLLQPNMVLSLRANWASFEDYLADFTSKYRVRAKRAFKKGERITKRELTISSIQSFLPQIDRLYQAIAEKANFNVVRLDGNYFLQFKKHFPEKFRVFAYFIEEEMVAFYTTFKNHEELEAHFLGFDETTNREYQVYLNILYDIIRVGIESKVEKINFARTALEIKSSVGAVAEDLFYFGKHTSSLKNKLFSPVLEYFQPKDEWVPRNPFKNS